MAILYMRATHNASITAGGYTLDAMARRQPQNVGRLLKSRSGRQYTETSRATTTQRDHVDLGPHSS